MASTAKYKPNTAMSEDAYREMFSTDAKARAYLEVQICSAVWIKWLKTMRHMPVEKIKIDIS